MSKLQQPGGISIEQSTHSALLHVMCMSLYKMWTKKKTKHQLILWSLPVTRGTEMQKVIKLAQKQIWLAPKKRKLFHNTAQV